MSLIRYNKILPTFWGSFFDDDTNFPSIFNWPDSNANQGLEVYETDNDIVVKAAVPGVPEDKIEVTVEGNILTIKGEYEETKEEKEKKKVVYKSFRQSSFNYSTSLPRLVDGSKATAEVENGVVTVTVPKVEEEKPKKIQVKKSK